MVLLFARVDALDPGNQLGIASSQTGAEVMEAGQAFGFHWGTPRQCGPQCSLSASRSSELRAKERQGDHSNTIGTAVGLRPCGQDHQVAEVVPYFVA